MSAAERPGADRPEPGQPEAAHAEEPASPHTAAAVPAPRAPQEYAEDTPLAEDAPVAEDTPIPAQRTAADAGTTEPRAGGRPVVPDPRSGDDPSSAGPSAAPRTAEGAALLADGRAADAVEVLRHAVAAAEPGAADLLARAYLDSGSHAAAVEWLAPMVERGHVRFAGALGTALTALGDDAAAEGALRLAVESGDVAAANELAILLHDRNRGAEALQVLEAAAAAGDAQAPANVVELWLAEGDVAAAAAVAERYAHTSRPDTIVALADVRVREGRVDEAEQAYRDAARLGALRGHCAYAGFLVEVRGDVDAAARELTAARAADEPGWATSTARFLLDTGRPEEARTYLAAAVEEGDRAAAALLEEIDAADAGRDPGF